MKVYGCRCRLVCFNPHPNSIQALCQSTNPLGKIMDFLAEDAESMNKEFHHWMEERRKHETRAPKAEGAGTQTMAQVVECEEEIEALRRKVDGLKAEVLQNDVQIASLLDAVARGSS